MPTLQLQSNLDSDCRRRSQGFISTALYAKKRAVTTAKHHRSLVAYHRNLLAIWGGTAAAANRCISDRLVMRFAHFGLHLQEQRCP